MSFIVGLTGGIGSGKSAVAERFAARGAAVVDTDAIAHELTAAGGAAMPALAAAFGARIVAADGALDRPAMRTLAFADPALRARLEAILHPMIRSEAGRRCAQAGQPYVVLVVPLLVETGSYRGELDRILVVDCSEETQIRRVMTRSALARAEVERIMAAQVGRAARLAAADDVIDNEGDLARLDARVAELDGHYRRLAASRRP